jgi:hypothetical protein
MEESIEGGAYPSWIVEPKKKKKKFYDAISTAELI